MRFQLGPSSFFILVCLILLFACQPNTSKFSYQEQQLKNAKAEKLHDDGWDLHNEGRISESIQYFQEAIKIREEILEKSAIFEDKQLHDDILEGIIRSYNNLGISYLELGDFEKAEQYLMECLNRLNTYETDWGLYRPIRKAWAAHFLGQLDHKARGLQESLNKYNLGLSYYKIENDTSSIADVNNDIGALFADWREADSSIFFTSRALRTYNMIHHGFGKTTANLNLGYAYILKKKYLLAQQHLDSALYYSRQNTDQLTRFIYSAKTLHNKALAYRLDQDFELAQQNIDSAIYLNSFQNNSPDSYLSLAKNYSNKADIYLAQGDLANAKKYYERSIFQFGQQSKTLEVPIPFVIPEPDKIIGDKVGFIEAMAGLAKTFATMDNFTMALETYDKAIQYFDTFRKDFRDQQSKIQISNITKQIFEAAISLSYKTYPEKAFQYAETSKSYALLEAVRHYKAFDILGIDSKQLREENELRREVSNLEFQELNTDSIALKIELNEKRERLQNQLQQLAEKLKDNEGYQKLMSAAVSPAVEEIQGSILEENQALIEYFVGVDSTYIFYIAPNQKVNILAVPLPRDSINAHVKLLTSVLTSSNGGASDIQQGYEAEAYWFYQNLLTPITKKVGKLPQRLVIIPDDLLGYVPFDALLSAPVKEVGKYTDYQFLAREKAISYCYSVSLLKEMQQQLKEPGKKGVLIYTYQGERNTKFVEQTENLKKIFTEDWNQKNGFIQEMDSSQPEKSFREKARDYRFVHFSTHGEVNDSEPNLSFLRLPGSTEVDNLLYLYEIYNIQLAAEMVVTGACETGIGRFFNGEGIMSLARGFSYAGAQSIVTTLWAVNQSKTDDIINAFYVNLADNLSKDMALFKAKKDYLDSDKPLNEMAPYLWAGIIPVGNMASIKL